MTRTHRPKLVRLVDYTAANEANVSVPGSKSITNRALLIAALASGHSILRRPLFSEDTDVMRKCLALLGAKVGVLAESGDIAITGKGQLDTPRGELYVQNAGTAARFLTAAAALVPGPVTLDGNHHMRKRPIQPLLDAIIGLGVSVTSRKGFMPITISGGRGASLNTQGKPVIEIDAGLSSQYVSALMMIAPLLPYGLEIRLSDREKIDAAGYLEVTLDTMAAFGVAPSEHEQGRWVFEPGVYRAQDYAIEPDYSACTYFWAADILSPTRVNIAGSNPATTRQPDAKSEAVMRLFPNMPPEIDGSQMQDAVPTLAIMAAFNATPVRFTGIANLRVKECDRIYAVESGLNRIKPGLASVEGNDLIVHGRLEDDRHADWVEIDSFDDHRIAMAFSLIALRRSGISITNPRCVEKTYPEFWNELAKLGVSAEFSQEKL